MTYKTLRRSRDWPWLLQQWWWGLHQQPHFFLPSTHPTPWFLAARHFHRGSSIKMEQILKVLHTSTPSPKPISEDTRNGSGLQTLPFLGHHQLMMYLKKTWFGQGPWWDVPSLLSWLQEGVFAPVTIWVSSKACGLPGLLLTHTITLV